MKTLMAEELRAIIEDVLARELAGRVVEKLMERQKQALVVYTGSNIGVSAALEELRALGQEGFTYRIFFTRSAARILNTEEICAALKPEEVWIDVPGDSPEALTRRYDTILVPALTVNTAAHVASCMADTPGAAIILDGLMRGKNVIAARDGCCPDNPERARRGFHMAPALRERLSGNLRTLQSYGARLCNADHLARSARRAVEESFSGLLGGGSGTPAPAKEQAKAAPAAPASTGKTIELSIDGRVLSKRQLIPCPSHATVLVPNGTLVTQLAADEARIRGIQIKFKT